jgi:hypothetical protein
MAAAALTQSQPHQNHQMRISAQHQQQGETTKTGEQQRSTHNDTTALVDSVQTNLKLDNTTPVVPLTSKPLSTPVNSKLTIATGVDDESKTAARVREPLSAEVIS